MLNGVYAVNCLDGFSLFGTESVDLVVTDPPYGISFKSNRQGVDRKTSVVQRVDNVVRVNYFSSIEGDDNLPVVWLKACYGALKQNTACYIFCHWRQWGRLQEAVESAGFRVKNMIVLNKSNHGMGDLKGSYAPKHELLLFATKGKHKLNFPNGRDKDVWEVPVRFTGARRKHPNEKPLSWHTKAILNSSIEGDVVVDPFCGSGSALVEAVKLKRKAVGFEIDPVFAHMAQEALKGCV